MLYGVYELVRGVGGEDVEAAMRHTADLVALEQALGIYVERGVQDAVEAIPTAPALLGLAYVLFHFVGTAALLVWVHRRHPDRFPLVRTTFVVATGLALVGYVLYPAAPPRLADLGFSDTVTSCDRPRPELGPARRALQPVRGRAEPPLRVRADRRRRPRDRRLARGPSACSARVYPAAMLLIIVGTGNHFIVDAVLGGLVVVAGWLVARALVEQPVPRPARLVPSGSRA